MRRDDHLRIAHLSDLHVGHITANLVQLRHLLAPDEPGHGLLDMAARLVAGSWTERRSLLEPLFRSSHIMPDYETRNLVAVVQAARARGADHVVLTGDIANLGAASEFREAAAVLRAFGYSGSTLTVVPGNHDVINFRGTPGFRPLVTARDYPHLDLVNDSVCAVALDTTARAPDLDWRDALVLNSRGIVRPSDVETVDRLLRDAPPESFRILCCHHHLVDLPPDGYVEAWSDKVDHRLAGRAANAEALLDVAQARGVGLILFGHRHRATHDRFTIRGIPAACSGAVTELGPDGLLRFRIFEFEGNRLVGAEWVAVSPLQASPQLVARAIDGVSALEDDARAHVSAAVDGSMTRKDWGSMRRRVNALDRDLLSRMKARLGKK